jgi:hypothetical protein
MYEVVFFITVVLLLAIIILFIYVALSQDIFDVLQPRIDDKLKDDKYLNTTNFSEEKKVEEEINKNIDSKIGTLPSESSNVVDYINTRITDSNTRTTAETDTKISNIVGDMDTKYDFLKKEGDESNFNYQIGNPALTDKDINLVNDVNINSELKICDNNNDACYSFKVDANENLVITKNASGNVRIEDHLYTNDYSRIDGSGGTPTSLDNILQTKLNLYPKKSEYTHSYDGTTYTFNNGADAIYPTILSYNQHGISNVNDKGLTAEQHSYLPEKGDYVTKTEYDKHYHKSLWSGILASAGDNSYQDDDGNSYNRPSDDILKPWNFSSSTYTQIS